MAREKAYCPQKFELKFMSIIDDLIAEKSTLPEGVYKDISINEIAQAFNVNTATLRRWCNTYVQQSPKHYLARYRLDKAKSLLKQGKKPSTVAKMLAFSEHKSFCQVFKRYETMSPTDYLASIS